MALPLYIGIYIMKMGQLIHGQFLKVPANELRMILAFLTHAHP